MPRKAQWPPPIYTKQGRAFVRLRINGTTKDVRLGPAGSKEAREQYLRVVAEVEAGQDVGPTPRDLTVDDVIARFLEHAQTAYSDRGEWKAHWPLILRPLSALYGSQPAAAVTAKSLETLQREMAAGSWMTPDEQQQARQIGWCRNTINRRVVAIRTAWKWAEKEGLVPPGSYHHLLTVRAVPKNASWVRHTAPRKPTSRADLDAVLPHCPPAVAAMLELQWLVGMRSGEVAAMRPRDLDQSDPACWLYRPSDDAGNLKDKTDWMDDGHARVVPLGPACQALITPFLPGAGPDDFLFRPLAARRKKDGEASYAPGDCKYDIWTYDQAVARACVKAGVKIIPYSGRHATCVRITALAGADAARAVLGHRSLSSTQVYSHRDIEQAKEVAKKYA